MPCFNQTIDYKVVSLQDSITEEEKEILSKIPVREDSTPFEDITCDILYALVKRRCIRQGVSQNLIFPKSSIRKFRKNSEWLGDQWRAEVLGADLLKLLKNMHQVKFDVTDGVFTLK